ncbi:MAG: uroporphyrinogen-III C-methyltransferase [Candidatus Eremiobacteraeota bacterium]|nr:uroporphyrinogen-III C-methyltransferase [Candidatus Eremiobacteraeota bacterium]
MTAPRRGRVALVGAGPGDPGLITVKGARLIAQCDVLVYDYLAAAPIVALARPDCEKIYVGKKAGAHTLSQDEITALLVRLAGEGKRVVRLKGGDVFVFARGGEEARDLHAAGVAFEIVPGITSAIAAPAYAGIPVTHRDHNTAFTIATGHEDPLKGYSSLDFAKLADPGKTLVFLMAMGSLAGIVARLLENGLGAETPVAIVREGTKPQQETLVATLGTIVAEVERVGFAAPAIVVIGDVVREREPIRWFDNGPLFGKKILITRPQGAAEEFAARLWEFGAEPLVAPAIEIRLPADEAAAVRAVEAVREYAWVVFTSANGVESFFDRLTARGADARALGDVRVAAIGAKTADRLAVRGVIADFVPDEFVGEAVAAGLLERTEPGERILIFGAQEARDVIPDTLRSAERVVDIVAGYQTVAQRDPAIAEAARAADIWTFASPSTVRAFLDNVPDATPLAAHKTVACIGPVTAAAARNAGLPVHVVAEEYTVDGLLAALENPAHEVLG